jgi:phenylacetate-coenzyme A ligase PaaK-like adenylate-forming protein
MSHIWRGKTVESLDGLLENLDKEIEETLNDPLKTSDVLDACESLSERIISGKAENLRDALVRDGSDDPDSVLSALAQGISREALTRKLIAELGTDEPFEVTRVDMKKQHYEGWAPVGVLLHITAGNSPIVAPMAAVEGLLSGNINILKVARNLGDFATEVLTYLSGFSNLGSHIYMLRVPSSDKKTMEFMMDRADCISAWGGEEAIAAIRKEAPRGTPVVEWGHKISFAYVSSSCIDGNTADMIAKSVCRNEQQSCSSPQCVLVDTDNKEEIDRMASLLAKALDKARETLPRKAPDRAESAEITTVRELHRSDLYFNDGDVIEDKEHTYRILISYTTKFMPSPLFRTVWLSPLKRENLVSGLRGMRRYLQTCGLVCPINELEGISSSLYRAGVQRITPADSMSASYAGEPHDGGFALPKFMRRVSMRVDIPMNGIIGMKELREPEPFVPEGPIQGKKDYPPVPEDGTRVLTKSGGTTGAPVFCSYSEGDYRRYIVEPGKKAMMALGLDPDKDVVADLLKAGSLYGGMNFFISIFDGMGVRNLNISGLDDVKQVAQFMVIGKATAVMGAPSYIIKVFQENHDLLKEYGRIRKIFYGGEMFSSGQVDWLDREFGIKDIQSMLYGANETGTMGYCCKCCGRNEFHLNSEIQRLEILKMDSDEPVAPGEPGRLIFTGYLRENGRTSRYEIGDMGEWIEGDCPCGRKEPRFRLLGRYGDVMRIGGTFFNFRRISKIFSDSFGYRGNMQILLETENLNDKMTVCIDDASVTTAEATDVLVKEYDSFAKTVPTGIMGFEVRNVGRDGFRVNKTSLKVTPVVDLR